MYLETNITDVSRNDAIQTVRGRLDKIRAELQDVMRQKWYVHTVTPIKPTPKMQHEQRIKAVKSIR